MAEAVPELLGRVDQIPYISIFSQWVLAFDQHFTADTDQLWLRTVTGLQAQLFQYRI